MQNISKTFFEYSNAYISQLSTHYPWREQDND
jgi:hypothetical protein